MITAVIDGQAYIVNDEDPKLLVGTGGEADVYRFSPTSGFTRHHGSRRYVLKIFRPATTDALRRAARERQTKLKEFPKGLPDRVISPIALAHDRGGQVIGYVMAFVPNGTPLISYKSATFCKDHSVSPGQILRIMANLHDLVNAVHATGVVIGDFNDKNVLVLPNDEVCLLDADSFQFGAWECPTFVPGFVDPQIVELQQGSTTFRKIGAHSPLTDWYAFMVMLFQLLVRVHPYTGGFYSSAQGEGPVKGVQRIARRISVFHPNVTLPPGIATPLDQIPAGIMACFRAVFQNEQRGVIPKKLLVEGTTPSARPATSPPPQNPQPHQRPTAHVHMLAARLQGGTQRYVFHAKGAYRREGGEAFWAAPYDARISAIPAGERTVMTSGDKFVIFDDECHSDGVVTQMSFGRPTIAANARHVYWLRGSELVRDDGRGGVFVIGQITAHLTSVWVGERFGVALVQAGVLNRVLTFTERSGFHTLSLPPSFGSIIDAFCIVGDDLAWLIVTTRHKSGHTVNRCFVIDAHAQLRATAETLQGDQTWLGSLTPAAHATGRKLLAAVPRLGIVRVGLSGDKARQELVYPDSSKLVPTKDATVALTYGAQGILHYGNASIDPIAQTL